MKSCQQDGAFSFERAASERAVKYAARRFDVGRSEARLLREHFLKRGKQELTQMIRWRQMRTGSKKAPNQAVQATPNDAFSSAVAGGAFWLGVPDLGR